ncbi:LSm family protein [Paenibacillus lentus]|uniref:LSm family protein n=1 Tax=Paenibacillus lentus TaxID=1338368 RepID=UPI00366425C4
MRILVEAYYNCLRCKNKRVRILTRDGRQYTGTIMDVDYNNVYLRPDARGVVKTSAFYPGFYGNDILTLSLFTLLAIALI